MKKILFLFLLLFNCCQLSIAQSDTTKYYIIGKVYKFDMQRGTKGVLIKLLNSKGELTDSVFTDADGEYEFLVKKAMDFTIISSLINTKDDTIIKHKSDFNKGKIAYSSIGKKGVIAIENIYFNKNDIDLTQESLKKLACLLNALTEYPSMRIEVKSHNDFREDKNIADQRNKSVLNYLIKEGIESNRIKCTSCGNSMPVNRCVDATQHCTEQELQKNRRVEFKILSF